ncbi:hypothetical protein, partial [Mesorhizobium sp.]|uniref:hypothetical protein n=1 Tax=Mesorhizobium sp. TaxID=1871066 RepID=UPI0025B9D171
HLEARGHEQRGKQEPRGEKQRVAVHGPPPLPVSGNAPALGAVYACNRKTKKRREKFRAANFSLGGEGDQPRLASIE